MMISILFLAAFANELSLHSPLSWMGVLLDCRWIILITPDRSQFPFGLLSPSLDYSTSIILLPIVYRRLTVPVIHQQLATFRISTSRHNRCSVIPLSARPTGLRCSIEKLRWNSLCLPPHSQRILTSSLLFTFRRMLAVQAFHFFSSFSHPLVILVSS